MVAAKILKTARLSPMSTLWRSMRINRRFYAQCRSGIASYFAKLNQTPNKWIMRSPGFRSGNEVRGKHVRDLIHLIPVVSCRGEDREELDSNLGTVLCPQITQAMPCYKVEHKPWRCRGYD
jgi:hypothetical protein